MTPRPSADRPQASPGINDIGLVLGADTRLMRRIGPANDLAIEADRERLLALLSVVARRPFSVDILAPIAAASAHWQRGDKALANLRLVFSGLPQLTDPSDVQRLRLAEWLLDEGMPPRVLMKELGLDPASLDVVKYDPDQPRVPAGSGSTSGQWTSDSDGPAFLAPLTVTRAAPSFLEGASPDIVAALTAFAARFATPIAVLGALFIPTPDSGGVTDGTLPDAPDIQFRKDGPAGTLQLTTADGSVVVAENHRGLYIDVETGQAIGRDLGAQLYLDLDAVRDALQNDALEDEGIEPKAGTDTDEDEPKLCPAPTEDTPHYATDRAMGYEDDVHARVNPLAPLPGGFGVKVFNPVTGEYVFFDDCFRYAGDLVDGDMQAGDLVEAKGPTKEFLYSRGWSIDDDVGQAQKELQAAEDRGVGLKWYYAEPGAALKARERFDDAGLEDIVIGVMPPRRRR